MEVLHRPGALYGSQPSAMFAPGMQRMFTPPSDVYSCYSFEANTPSRTPTPERAGRIHSKHGVMMDVTSHATTLQSVLRGEIPAAYSHLATSASSSNSSLSTSPTMSSFYSPHTSSMELDSHHLHHHLLRPVPSPCPSHHSSLSYSPRPQSHESHTSQDSDVQTEPMDLSCKKTSRKRTAVSAFLDASSKHDASPVLSSSLPAKFNVSSEFLSTLPSSSFTSSSSPSMHSFPPSPGDGQQGEEFSLLRNLLSVGKHFSNSTGLSNSTPNLSSERGCESPASDSYPRTPVTGTTKVQLAKKNLFPVSARVSDWLVKIVQFAKSIPEFSSLSHNDKVTLTLNSWSRLMLLYMAESNFQFAVTPIPTIDSSSVESSPSQDEPTMKSVEGVQTFIKKCQQMSVDSKEYEFLRMLVLFNAGYVGLSCPETIDQLNSVVQQLLQQHVRVSRPKDVMHYSRLLMCLPSLYGTNSKMFESLFCKHISKNTDMEVLLKELLQNMSTSL
ncbi:photoreceptor-specific nuclear receptor-like [Physella acuta]|uniref:photoreceptor-specific nuclear receptor-like n=1 Tax=Physella acuta TaxID=109671 RepID=UPI0027DD7B3A|nr:photoreceptor-specific nuclear receptor-like [Physella acuta]XP_059138474.1 photoreceptor-specific nuclear receptor-like [Physella acuta]